MVGGRHLGTQSCVCETNMPESNHLSQIPYQERLEATFKEIKLETDRHAAILAANVLEFSLIEMTKSRMINSSYTEYSTVFEVYGPLSTFSAKYILDLSSVY